MNLRFQGDLSYLRITMMKISFLFLLATLQTTAQISNVRQTEADGRIIITYDLTGYSVDHFALSITATNENGDTVRPAAIVGDLVKVAPGQGRTIWWEPQLEGLTTAGWKIALNAKEVSGISWVKVEGGPSGDFYISATEVTFDQFWRFCDTTGYIKPIGEARFGKGQQPVINVNVADAVAFCQWLSKVTSTTVRLPEESEWEYAARGGKKSKGFEYIGSDKIDEIAWYMGNSAGSTHEVAVKKPNELGIYDIEPASGLSLGRRLRTDPVHCVAYIGFRVLQKR